LRITHFGREEAPGQVSPSDGENDRLLRLWAKGASKVMERALENLTPSLAPRKWWGRLRLCPA
jgi:hypothetical protein